VVPRGDAESHFGAHWNGAAAIDYGRAVHEVVPAALAVFDQPVAGVLVERRHHAPAQTRQWTILAMASSMMSLAPASFRAGMRVLISALGTTVSTAYASPPNSCDTVGDRRAGSR